MNTAVRMLQLVCLTLAIFSASASADSPPTPPQPIPRTTEHRDLRYLPDWRYPEDGESLRASQMTMDIVVPDDGGDRHPVLFVVHGGGWSGGDKGQKIYRQIMAHFADRGYVTVGFNYIMRPRGIFPQVLWDYETAARFLRTHAATYRVDPARIGAIGLSAGGWLISSVGHGTGDLLLRNHQQSTHLGELWERDWRRPDDDWNESFPRPGANPAPVYPDTYGRMQAISLDFHFRIQFASGNSPAMNQWVGDGYEGRPEEQQALALGKFDYDFTRMTHPSFAGKKLHVPPLFESVKKGLNGAEAIAIDGKSRVDAIERIAQFFHYQFSENPRTPVPEIRPTRRFFEDSTKVRFLMPAEGATIRYQVLRLEKQKGKRWHESYPPARDEDWAQWKLHDGPFKLTESSLVRAVAQTEGHRPSTIAEAHFFEGVTTPKITAPAGRELPPARTGQRYGIKFEADTPTPRWFLAGDLVTWVHRKEGRHHPNGMIFDSHAGTWSGTPQKPGKFWIQVWVNGESGEPAGFRDYTWHVTGEDLTPDKDLYHAGPTEPLVKLAYLPPSNIRASRLDGPLTLHGIRCHIEPGDHGDSLFVPAADKPKARTVVEDQLGQWKYRGSVSWVE